MRDNPVDMSLVMDCENRHLLRADFCLYAYLHVSLQASLLFHHFVFLGPQAMLGTSNSLILQEFDYQREENLPFLNYKSTFWT